MTTTELIHQGVAARTLIATGAGLAAAHWLFQTSNTPRAPVPFAAAASALERREQPRLPQAAHAGQRPVHLLTTDAGYSLRATPDTHMMCEAGWKTLAELTTGDRVAVTMAGGGFGTVGTQWEGFDHAASVSGKTSPFPLLDWQRLLIRQCSPTVAGRIDSLDRGGAAGVPILVLRGNRAQQTGFLQLLATLHSDVGEFEGVPAVRLHLPDSLRRDVQLLLANFGIVSFERRDEDCLEVRGGSVLLFMSEIGFLSSERHYALDRALKRANLEPETYLVSVKDSRPDGVDDVFFISGGGHDVHGANGFSIYSSQQGLSPGRAGDLHCPVYGPSTGMLIN